MNKWQPIKTAPRNEKVFFWIIPKTAEEAYCNTSGEPIVSDHAPYRMFGRYKTWGGLSKATHWHPDFDGPEEGV